MRKAVHLMSNPIFGGYTFDLVAYDPKKYTYNHSKPQQANQNEVEERETPYQGISEEVAIKVKTEKKITSKQAKPKKTEKKTLPKSQQKKDSTTRQSKNLARLKSADALPRR